MGGTTTPTRTSGSSHRDRGRPRRLTDTHEDDWNPSWSPDGEQVAFDRNDDGRNWVYVVNPNGTGLRRLTGVNNWNPVWTSDGRISYINDRGIWVVNPDGTDRHLLARAKVDLSTIGTPFAWSPDGGAIAFTTDTALWVMRADGTRRHKIFGDPNREHQGSRLVARREQDRVDSGRRRSRDLCREPRRHRHTQRHRQRWRHGRTADLVFRQPLDRLFEALRE